MLVGPNGAGKSTIIKVIAKALNYTGAIKLNGIDIQNINNINYASEIGFLSQSNLVAFDFSVEEIVSMGRYCHRESLFKSLNKDDKNMIDAAIEITGLTKIRKKSVLELSGGEVQRTFIAQLFAQDPKMLVLDEPTNNLDLVYQEQIFKLISDWIKNKEITVLSVVHDLSIAKLYGTQTILLSDGEIISSGDCCRVLTKENLIKAYKMDVNAYMKKVYKCWK